MATDSTTRGPDVAFKPTAFSGTSDQDFDTCLRNFARYAQFHSLDDTQLAHVFSVLLTGPAKLFYNGLPDSDKNSFRNLSDAFKARFSPGKLGSVGQVLPTTTHHATQTTDAIHACCKHLQDDDGQNDDEDNEDDDQDHNDRLISTMMMGVQRNIIRRVLLTHLEETTDIVGHLDTSHNHCCCPHRCHRPPTEPLTNTLQHYRRICITRSVTTTKDNDQDEQPPDNNENISFDQP